MIEKYSDAEAAITIEGRTYALYKKGSLNLKGYPYIVDISTGEIPKQEQSPLMKTYLRQNGVNIGRKWTTHMLIRQAIKVAQKNNV